MLKETLLSNNPDHIRIGDIHFEFTQPEKESSGVVVFFQDTGLGPASHNSALAKTFNKNKLTTLIADFRNPSLGMTDVPSLAGQLQRAVQWVRDQAPAQPIGYFGAGSGAEAALVAAALEPRFPQAVVVRGGYPDTFSPLLPLIKAPVLLIAPGRNRACIRSNQAALTKLNKESAINIISTASVAFQEPGVLEESAQLASLWFLQHLE